MSTTVSTLICAVIHAAPTPIQLVRSGADPGPSAVPGDGGGIGALLLGVCLLSVAVGIWLWLGLRWVHSNPGERSFRAVARRLRLSRNRCAQVRALAACHPRAEPVALLLSRSAFTLAVRRASRMDDAPRESELEALERAIFS